MDEEIVEVRFENAAKKLKNIVEALCDDTGFDYETAIYVVGTFLKQTELILREINKIINQENIFEKNAIEVMSKALHKLKGSAGNVRATEIMELSIRAEEACLNRDRETLLYLVNTLNQLMDRYLDN
ncbi:Hpt domain-containing protein [Fusibacter bizertensis]